MSKFNQNGDTLIEVILALAILAFVLLSSFNIAERAFFVGAASRERTQAANLGQEQAEALHNYRDSNIQTWPLPGTISVFNMVPAATGWNAAGGSVISGIFTIQISPVPIFPVDPNQARFKIEVGWDGSGGGAQVSCGGLMRLNCSTIVTDLVNLR